MGAKHATRDDVERAKLLMSQGKTATAAAHEIGRHPATVARWADDWPAALARSRTPRKKRPSESTAGASANAASGSAAQTSEPPAEGAPTGGGPPIVPGGVAALKVEQTPLPRIGSDTGNDEPHFCSNCKVVLDHVERPARCPNCEGKLRWDKVSP